MGDLLYLDENKMKSSFFKTDQVFEIWVGPGFKFISPYNSRINLKNSAWSLQFISFRVSRLRFNSCLVVEMFLFNFNDSIVTKVFFTALFKLFWSSFSLSVLNRKNESEIWLSKKNANSFVCVLVNCFSPNTGDKATFIK